jgi:hypothetical protein
MESCKGWRWEGYFILKLDREINYLRYTFFKALLQHEATCPSCKK